MGDCFKALTLVSPADKHNCEHRLDQSTKSGNVNQLCANLTGTRDSIVISEDNTVLGSVEAKCLYTVDTL